MRINKHANVFTILLFITIVALIMLTYRLYSTPYYPPVRLPKPALGNASSQITVTVYSDLECPACKKFHPSFEKIIDEFSSKARFEFRHFPLTLIHENAMMAAEAAECANDQGKFWEFIDLMYKSETTDKKAVDKAAKILRLEIERFDNCIRSSAKKDIVLEELRYAESQSFRGTPTVKINDRVIGAVDYDGLKKELEKEISAQAGAQG